MLRHLFAFLNRDLTGHTWTRELVHPYFGRMTQFCHKGGVNDYWEAEITVPELKERISVIFSGRSDGPEDSELSFCRQVVLDLDGLLERCRPAFTEVLNTRLKEPTPMNWRAAFRLDGFEIPTHGDSNAEWHVCYFADSVHRYLTANFKNAAVTYVTVDG